MKNLGLARRFVWATPAAALGAVGLPLAMLIPNFYIEVVGIAPASAAMIFLLMRLWDGISDPLLGIASDRFQPPLGRRRFWVVLATPVLCISIWMIFAPPGGAGPWYLAGWLMLFYAGVTAMQVSHLSWGAELCSNPTERTRMMGLYELFVIGGMLTLLAAMALLETGTSSADIDQQRAETLCVLAIILGLAFLIGTLLAVALIPEGAQNQKFSFSFRESARAIRGNANLLRVLSANLAYRAATGVSGTLFFWYFGSRLDLDSVAALVLTAYFVTGLLAMPAWIWLATRIGKGLTFMIGVAIAAALSVPMAMLDGTEGAGVLNIGPMSFNSAQLGGMALSAFTGMTFGVAPFIGRAMIAEVAEEDEALNHAVRRGLFFALLTFSEKLGFALAVGFSVLMLDVIGFATGPGAAPSAAAVERLAIVYAIAPAALFMVAAWLIRGYSLEERLSTSWDKGSTNSAEGALA